MHEIRLTVRPERLEALLQVATTAGISRANVADTALREGAATVAVKDVSLVTSTPRAGKFVQLLRDTPLLEDEHASMTLRELRAIVNDEHDCAVTRPMGEPLPDVVQDLWQQCHLTSSYVARAVAGGLLLACGMWENSPIEIVVAALFMPFLSPLMAAVFGLYKKSPDLVWHGCRALLISFVIAFAAGAALSLVHDGPMLFSDFKSPLRSFFMSCIIGATAGLCSADDAGRRYLIGVAAAVQLAIFPVWLGYALAEGFALDLYLPQRLESFAINMVTIPAVAITAYVIARRIHHSRS